MHSRTEERPITDREVEVLEVLSNGGGTAAAARVLGVAPDTLRTHRQNILRALHVDTMAAAVAVALRNGWIT